MSATRDNIKVFARLASRERQSKNMSAERVDSDRLRIGVFGGGSFGRQFVRVFDAHPETELRGVTGVTPDADPHRETEYAVVDRETLLTECDAVAIDTQTEEHATDISDCLDVGTDVFVTPPFVTDPATGRELLTTATDRGCVVYTGHFDRHNPAITHLRRYLSSAVDEIVAIEAQRHSPPPAEPVDDDIIMGSLVKDIDILDTLFEWSVDRVDATCTDEYGVATLQFESDTVGTLKASCVSQQTVRRLTVTTPTVYIETDLLDQSLSVYRHNASAYVEDDGKRQFQEQNTIEQPTITRQEPLKTAVEEFVSTVRQRDALTATAEDALRSIEIGVRLQNQIARPATTSEGGSV